MKEYFTAGDINNIFKLSRQRLHQLNLLDIIVPSIEKAKPGGNSKYSFTDLIDIYLAIKLLFFGVRLSVLKMLITDFRRALYKGYEAPFETVGAIWEHATHLLIYIVPDKGRPAGDPTDRGRPDGSAWGYRPFNIKNKDDRRLFNKRCEKEDRLIIDLLLLKKNLKYAVENNCPLPDVDREEIKKVILF